MQSFWLHRYSVLVAISTLMLIVAGASVTSNQAGLSVPDWPLSYGQVMPEMKDGVLYEHGHRMIASFVGVLTIVLAVWLWRAEERRWMRRLGWIALGAVILQGVLGGVTVLFLLPPGVSIAHACIAQLFFSLTVAMAVFTSHTWQAPVDVVNDAGWPSLRALAVIAPISVLAQVALGAASRHGVLGTLPHIGGAVFVLLVVLFVCIAALSHPGVGRVLKRSANVLLSITVAQIMLGVVAYLARLSAPGAAAPGRWLVATTVAHVAGGALTLAATVVLSLHIFRNVRPYAEAPSGVAAVS